MATNWNNVGSAAVQSISGIGLVDLHLHQERSARLNQALAVRGQQAAVDWERWAEHLETAIPAGISRLAELWASRPTAFEHDSPDMIEQRLYAVLQEAAGAGAVLAEVRIGNETALTPEVFDRFRMAEQQVQVAYPDFRASLVVTLKLWHDPIELEAAVQVCLGGGVDGVDFLYLPYASKADWVPAYRLADRIAAAGLGITAHTGEFSPSNIAEALRVPGLTRLGHAVHAAAHPRLLEAVLAAGVAVECCLTSNVILGAVGSLDQHPIRALRAAGVPVVLGTDNPLQFGTTIAHEYARARALGISTVELRAMSREAVRRSFLPVSRRAELLALPSLADALPVTPPAPVARR